MTVKQVLELIVKNKHLLALNYCVHYANNALYALRGNYYEQEFKIQLLYVLNNMTHWRQCKASDTTAAEIKECRVVLKKASV